MDNNLISSLDFGGPGSKEPNNLLVTLSSRRRANAKNQLRSILLEMYELFGSDFVNDVTSDCHQIYLDYCKLIKPSKRTKSSSK